MKTIININDTYRLTSFAYEDMGELVKCMEDMEIYNNTITIPYPYSTEIAFDFMNKQISGNDCESYYAIRDNDLLIGSIGLRIEKFPHKGIVGYWLRKEYRGNGIMTNALIAFVNFAFKQFNLVRISASCFEHNIRSARVLENSGFIFEGLMFNYYKKENKIFNGKLYAITK